MMVMMMMMKTLMMNMRTETIWYTTPGAFATVSFQRITLLGTAKTANQWDWLNQRFKWSSYH